MKIFGRVNSHLITTPSPHTHTHTQQGKFHSPKTSDNKVSKFLNVIIKRLSIVWKEMGKYFTLLSPSGYGSVRLIFKF